MLSKSFLENDVVKITSLSFNLSKKFTSSWHWCHEQIQSSMRSTNYQKQDVIAKFALGLAIQITRTWITRIWWSLPEPDIRSLIPGYFGYQNCIKKLAFFVNLHTKITFFCSFFQQQKKAYHFANFGHIFRALPKQPKKCSFSMQFQNPDNPDTRTRKSLPSLLKTRVIGNPNLPHSIIYLLTVIVAEKESFHTLWSLNLQILLGSLSRHSKVGLMKLN